MRVQRSLPVQQLAVCRAFAVTPIDTESFANKTRRLSGLCFITQVSCDRCSPSQCSDYISERFAVEVGIKL